MIQQLGVIPIEDVKRSARFDMVKVPHHPVIQLVPLRLHQPLNMLSEFRHTTAYAIDSGRVTYLSFPHFGHRSSEGITLPSDSSNALLLLWSELCLEVFLVSPPLRDQVFRNTLASIASPPFLLLIIWDALLLLGLRFKVTVFAGIQR